MIEIYTHDLTMSARPIVTTSCPSLPSHVNARNDTQVDDR